MILEEKDLLHYGILRKSGRYPWGSGGNTEQRSKSFLDYINDLKRRLGLSNAEIAKLISTEDYPFSTTDLVAAKVIAKNEIKAAQISMAQRLKEKGYSNVAIGTRMGLNESSVRALLEPGANAKIDALNSTVSRLRDEVDQKRYIDVGSGVENYLGVSNERKKVALAMLKEEGYKIQYVKVPQPGTGKETSVMVLTSPDVTYSELYKNRDKIKFLQSFSDDGGRSYYGIVEPLSISPKRLQVRYGDEGGSLEDGVIYVRPGVKDLSLGGSRYAQVRIKIGDDHYIKGMAIYKDDLPDGVDLIFNTAKEKTKDKLEALKPLAEDPDNPFGSYIKRQILERDSNGNDRAISAMNIVNEEGNWGGGSINPKTGEVDKGWSKTLASQVLSKQSPELAKNQLAMTFERRQKEFDEIMALTNPTVRKKLLEEFADGTDSASVHLKAAALPRQRWQVILPIGTLSDKEIYAPNFRDGEQVALIRYPHGGTFEIPELKVNNRHSDSKKILGDSKDAVGINAKVAERLSGADFDGDTVLVIPNNSRQIRTSSALTQLKGFNPASAYPGYEGMPVLSESRKQREMGDVSNLITDMTIKGASHDKIARAVRHSMVVIDAVKHNLNHRQSAIDNGIRQLKEEYQGSPRAGAATLISLAKSPERIPERKDRRASLGGPVDPVTGRRQYELTGRTYVNKQGQVVPSMTKVKRLANVDDANELSSGTRIERIYAEHSNKLKAMANEARRVAVNTPRTKRDPNAAKVYANEVTTLKAKLDLAIRNRPLERQALVLADAVVRQKRSANPNMDDETKKKIKFQALEEMRNRTKAKRHRIEITPKEWEAIQAGAISDSMLSSILNNANMDVVKQHATPRTKLLMSPSKTKRAADMLRLGFTRAEVADQLGVSTSTLDQAMANG